MATVTNWIDHLSASEVQGAIYPGVGSEGILVILGFIIWIGWHVITAIIAPYFAFGQANLAILLGVLLIFS